MRKIYSLMILLAFAYNAGAQTIYYVKISSGSDASSGTSWSSAFRNLTKALAAANASSASEVQIWIADGTYTPEDGVSSLPSDHQDTSFTFYRGNGVGRALKVYGGFAGTESSISARDTVHTTYLDGIISTGNSYHIGVIVGLSAAADSVVLDRLTFSNGLASGTYAKAYNGYYIEQFYGAGLAVIGDSSLKIAVRNCTFTANTANTSYTSSSAYMAAPTRGGAVVVQASFGCLFDRCKFVNNIANNTTIYYSGSSSGRSGGSSYGGAIYVGSSNIRVRNCIFDNNYAKGCDAGVSGWGYYYGGGGIGGAICFYNSSASVIEKCVFTRNHVICGSGDYAGGSSGGAIYNEQSGTLVTNSSFIGCYCTDTGMASPWDHTSGGKYGGAIANRWSSYGRIDSCIFNQNRNFNYMTGDTYGGAIYDEYSIDTVSNCTILNCTSNYGGALTSHNRSNTVIINTKIKYNNSINSSSLYKGGAINVTYHSFPIVVGCTIDSNNGGAIRSTASTLHLRSSKITNNQGGGIVSEFSNLYLDTCTFQGNTSDYGGAILTSDTLAVPTHCIFSNNYASVEGGAIYSGASSGFVSSFKSNGNVFVKNRAGKGGAISVNTCTTCNDTLVNNIFSGNKSTDNSLGGGAIAVGASRNYIYNNTFLSDTATGRGGAIRVEGTGGLVRAANNIFYKSVATGSSTDTSVVGTGSIVFYNNIFTGTNPQFMDTTNFRGADTTWGTADDGIRLRHCSPGINTGNNAYVFATELVDIAGNLRINESTVDIGAFENGNLGAIVGPASVCVGTTTTYTDTPSGGTWTSSTPSVATISTSGVLRALTQGTTIISYAATSSCGGGSLSAVKLITVDRPVSAIVGMDTICLGGTSLLTDTTVGGTWLSRNNTIATVNLSGLVTATGQGIDTISYSVSNSCGTSTAIRRVIVQRPVSPISGPTVICMGGAVTYLDSATGGVWSVSDTTVATINSSSGVLTPRRAGFTHMTYAISNRCGTSYTYYSVLIERAPSAIIVADSICTGSWHISPTDSVSGGVWRISNTTVLSLYDSTTGIFLTTAPGRDTLSHIISNSCGSFVRTKVIAVVGYGVGTITGRDSICVGDTAVMHDTIIGATWSSDNIAVATISTTGIVTGVSGGTVTISYSVINACGLQLATHNLYVTALPAPTITGSSSSVCVGGGLALTGSPSGGTWSAVNTNATVDIYGVVSGAIVGTDTIKYAVSNTCGTTVFAYPVTIMDVPLVSSVSGPSTVCQFKSITLTPATSGGVWSTTSGNATVSSSGVVTGVNPGADNVVYTMSNICGGSPFSYPVTVYSKDYCDSAAGVSTVNSAKTAITVYPNPATDKLTIELKSEITENVTIIMTNVVGEKVKEWNMMSNKASDKELSLPPGVYILTATTGNYKFVTRVVVE